jgi:DNA-binding transcriptional LysR family regulator
MDRLAALTSFARVATLGSFSAAARALGTTQSNVSRAVRQLETHLGASLLRRTTRSVSLTSEGAEYLEHTLRIIDEFELADASVGVRAKTLSGALRVFAPVSLAGC